MKRPLILLLGAVFYTAFTATPALPAAYDTWVPHASAQNWSGVASSSDGVNLVAVVNGGLTSRRVCFDRQAGCGFCDSVAGG